MGTVGPITWPYDDGANTGLGPDDGVDGSGNDEWWVMYTYTVQPGDPDPLVNLVTVAGTASTGEVNVIASAELALVAGDLLLTKTAVDQAAIGQTVTYTLTVENLGDTAILGVDITDPLSPSGDAPIPACHVNTLAAAGQAGSVNTCTFDYTVSAADPAPLINTALAMGFIGTTAITDTASHTLNIVTGDLLVTKTANATVAAVGDDVIFTYRVENTGTSDITNLFVQDTDPNVDFSSNPWPTSLAPGAAAVRTWTKTMAAADPDPYTNTVLVTGEIGDTGQPVSGQATETVYIATGDLVVTNTPNAAWVLAGDQVTFTYTIQNTGTSHLTALNITDTLCDDLALNAQLPSTTLGAGASFSVYCTVLAPLGPSPAPVVSTVNVTATGPGRCTVRLGYGGSCRDDGQSARHQDGGCHFRSARPGHHLHRDGNERRSGVAERLRGR